LPQGSNIDYLESFSNDFFAFGNSNIVFKYSNNQWDTIIYQPNELLRNFKVSEQTLITCTESYVTIYNQNLDTLDLLYAYNGTSGISPNDIIDANGYYWIADDSKGFVRFKNNFSSERIGQGGPFTSECFHLSSMGENLYVAAGTPDGTNWNKTFNWHGVFQFNNSWIFYNQINTPIMAQEIDTISDIVWTTPNPKNENKFLASSFGGGLLSFNNNQLEERFTFHNSSLQTRIGQNGNNVFVAGASYDNLDNLWVANSFVTSPLSVQTPEGVWKSFYCGSLASNQLCTDLIVDNQYGYIWMIIKGVGILVYDFNQTPLDESDDQYKIIGTSSGSGSLPSSYVNTLAIDNDGEIWIGTDKGPGVFYSSYAIMNESSYDAQSILIEQDGNLQYLLENEIIKDIVVDGANRKWIATQGGGLFLLSKEGTQTIYSFSESNSPLFSDKVNSLAINQLTGEVFIATDKGVLGFKSTATSPANEYEELIVYPNPVRPEYQGNIAVKGMMNNSEVKITDASGLHIKTIFSNGGQAVWDGLDKNNQVVGSGVYYFLATSEDGYSKAKSKILIIR
jgi:ligand-binding sensor domain-containing protein